MITHILKTSSRKTFKIDTSDDTWIVAKGVEISIANGIGITQKKNSFHDSLIQILGDISVKAGNGIDLSGRDDTVYVGGSGNISAGQGFGVAFGSLAYGADLENHGTIVSTGTGVGMYSTASPDIGKEIVAHIDNFGKIVGDSAGVDSTWDPLVITNRHGALISGGEGISGVSGSLTIRNDGTIRAGDTGIAIAGGMAGNRITNTGTIKGNINLGDGNDTFTSKHGSVSGTIDGGYGDDTYIVDKAGLHLKEDDVTGTDLVKSSVNWTLGDNFENLTLTGKAAINAKGNELANIITGNKGGNIITGLGGADTLKGGGGADHFVFAAGSGSDTIQDFHHGVDVIDLSHYAGIEGLQNLNIADGDNGATITLNADASDMIMLDGVSAADLAAGDFVFAS